MLWATPAQATLVGRGQIDFVYGGGPGAMPIPGANFAFTGTITFDDESFVVDGNPVNLGTAVGTLDISGFLRTDVGLGDFGIVHYTADTNPAGSWTYSLPEGANVASAKVTCTAATNCAPPAAMSQLAEISMTNLNATPTLPAASATVRYFASSLVTCDDQNQCSGPIGILVNQATTTDPGNNVETEIQTEVYYPGSNLTGSFTVTSNFTTVSVGGSTSVTPKDEPEAEVAEGFLISGLGERANVFDLSTSALISGDIQVCVSYLDEDDDGVVDGTGVRELYFRLLHDQGGTLVDVTTSKDPENNKICGNVPHLSEFALAVDTSAVSCPAMPEPICTSVASAKLSYNEKKAGKEKMKMQWKKATDALTAADFGNPVDSLTSVALCIYDDSDSLVQDFIVDRAGALCAGHDCWKAKGSVGFSYKDKASESDGISGISFKGGDAGKGGLSAKGKNNAAKAQMGLPIGVVTGLTGSINPTIQVLTADGLCIGASMNEVKKDDGQSYSAQYK